MRTRVASLFIAMTIVFVADRVGAAEEPSRAHNVLLFIASGMRPGMVNEQTTPTIAALLKRGVRFRNTHSLVPTVTIANAATMATGHMAGDTGGFGDTLYAGPSMGGSGLVSPLAGNASLADPGNRLAGNDLNEEAVLHAAAAAGLSTAVIGKAGAALIFAPGQSAGPETIIVDDQTGHAGGLPLSAEMQAALREFSLPAEAPLQDGSGAAPALPDATATASPPKPAVNVVRQNWFVDVAALAVLPIFRDRRKPFVMVFWSDEPDLTQRDQRDSPSRLVPGINGPTSLTVVRAVDSALARLLTTLKELGLETTTDVIVTSDHGASTISKESATSFAASQTYPDVPKGLLPPGFVAIDLAYALGLNLFDPDATAQAQPAPVPPGGHPARGNGLIGEDPSHPDVVVAANGGADLIYLARPDRVLAARIVRALAAQDYASGVFVDARLGSIGGTLPLSAVALAGSTRWPTPAIVLNFRSFSTGCADPADCGVAIADTVLQQGQGMNGSFSRADTRILMGAAGPGFRKGFLDVAPAGTADLGRTIAALLGLKLADTGRLTGRVLTEAMPGGTFVFGKRGRLKSAADDSGRVTELKFQAVGATRYFDAAGFAGRTLGLE